MDEDTTTDRGVFVQVLGDLRAHVDGKPVDLGGLQPERVLLALALAAPRAASLDRLVDTIWETPPPTAAKAIRVHVGRIRRILGSAAIETSPGGYRLGPSVGLDRLTYLARRTRSGDATNAGDEYHLLSEALSCWSGSDHLERAATARMEEALQSLERLRLADEERHSELLLTLGVHEEDLATLRSRCEQNPFSERRWEQLLRGLVLADRPAEAIEAYRRCRAHFGDELGVPPGPAVQSAYDKAIAMELGGTTFLERREPLIGREQDLENLDALVTEHPLVSVVGGPGMGKTTLCFELARRWQRRGEPAVVIEVPPRHRAHSAHRDMAGDLGVVRADEASAMAAIVARLTGVTMVVCDGAQRNEDAVAELVEELRAERPRLRVLVTGRTPLGIAGEVHLDLGPLTISREGDPGIGAGTMLYAVRRGLGARRGDGRATAADHTPPWTGGVPLLLELAGRMPGDGSIVRGDERCSTTAAIRSVVDAVDPLVARSAQRLGALPVDVSAQLLDRLGTQRSRQRALIWHGLADSAGPPMRLRAPDAVREAIGEEAGAALPDLRNEVRDHLIGLGRLARPELGAPPDYGRLDQIAGDLSSVRWLLAEPSGDALELVEQVADLLGMLGLSHEAFGPLGVAQASRLPLRRARATLARVRSLPLAIGVGEAGRTAEFRSAVHAFRRDGDRPAAALAASFATLHLHPNGDVETQAELSRLAAALAPSAWSAAVADLALGVSELAAGASRTALRRFEGAEAALVRVDQRGAALAAFLRGAHGDDAAATDPLDHLERARSGATVVGDRPLAAAARLVMLQHLRARGHLPSRGAYTSTATACDGAGLEGLAELARDLARMDLH